MQHRRPAWFRDLFGFDESSTWGDNVNHFQMDGDTLVCRTAPQFPRQFVGRFECPSVAELRSKLAAAQGAAAPSAGLSFAHLAAPAGVGPLHYEPSNAGAVFQAASQFNCLEMTGPNVSPTAGVGIYINDRTQGPACALACPAATVYRNYLVQHEGNTGQHPVQIDNLKEVGVVVGNNGGRYWVMQNGYAMPVGRGSLAELAARLRTEPNLVEQAEAALRVGVHWETSVAPPLEHRVCQVYASALPCAYARGPPESDWEPFARLVLRAAYEATLAVGAVRSLEAGGARVKCYLTALGGGVFGNRYEWIRDAISHALDLYQGWPLDVVLVHYGSRVDANWARDLPPRQPTATHKLIQSGGASRAMATTHASKLCTSQAVEPSAVGDFLRGSSTLAPRRSSSNGAPNPFELDRKSIVPTRQSSFPTSEVEQRLARLTTDSTSAHGSGQPSGSARALVRAQQDTLRGILSGLHKASPESWSKHSHWAWYVWPTDKVGMSDPRETGLHSADDVKFVLSHVATVADWTAILKAIARVLEAQGNRRSIPPIDHGRIAGFLNEWQQDAYRKCAPQGFLDAVKAFETAWTSAGS